MIFGQPPIVYHANERRLCEVMRFYNNLGLVSSSSSSSGSGCCWSSPNQTSGQHSSAIILLIFPPNCQIKIGQQEFPARQGPLLTPWLCCVQWSLVSGQRGYVTIKSDKHTRSGVSEWCWPGWLSPRSERLIWGLGVVGDLAGHNPGNLHGVVSCAGLFLLQLCQWHKRPSWFSRSLLWEESDKDEFDVIGNQVGLALKQCQDVQHMIDITR